MRASSLPPGVNSLDHSIFRQNGSTSALEFTAHRLQSAKFKPVPDLMTRIEELTKENGHLRQEIQFYRQCFEVLQRLRETSYNVYQQLFFLAASTTLSADRLQELVVQLHRGLEDSVKREIKAEKEWKAFWGIKFSFEDIAWELL